MEINKNKIIIENGTGLMKIGFSGNEEPNFVFNNILYRSKEKIEQYFIESNLNKNKYNSKYPMNCGIIENIDEMKIIWDYCFKLWKSNSINHSILISDNLKNKKNLKEEMLELFFEEYNIENFFAVNESILSLYSSGVTSGIICDIGDSYIKCSSIYESKLDELNFNYINIGGRNLNDYLNKIIYETVDNKINLDEDIIRSIKEQACYCPESYEEEFKNYIIKKVSDYPFKLPDGNYIYLKTQRFKLIEPFFNPDILNKDNNNIIDLIKITLNQSNKEFKKVLTDNIILVGGSSIFRGLKERLTKNLHEIRVLFDSKITQSIHAKYSSWIGGSIVSSLSLFNNNWITKNDYEEKGKQAIHKNNILFN